MNKVAYWRIRRGLTVRELSQKSGVNAAAISRIENAHTKAPLLATLLKLAEALEVDISEFQGMSKEERKTSGEPKAAPSVRSFRVRLTR